MTAEQYPAYLAYFVPDYAAEIAANFDMSLADAMAQATRDTARDLPDGPATLGHELLCLYTNDLCGYLWHKPDGPTTFILDFYIDPAHRGQGLALKAITAFEAGLATQGITQIKLRVAADNRRAYHVYLKAGFIETGINMAKTIDQV